MLAVITALLHMAPYWRALANTPAGWTFTGNLSVSPDYMQYRVWMRQTLDEGILIGNRFTTEPHRPHLPVPMYYAIGKISQLSGMTPEWVYAYVGGVLAVAFAILLFLTVRHFTGQRSVATAWIFVPLLFGGGLGGFLKFMQESDAIRSNYVLGNLFLEPLIGPGAAVPFEEFRGNYIVQSLFDTHFLTFWLFSTLAVLALYFTLRSFSYVRLAATATLFAMGTFLHVYEGVTLMAIAVGAVFVCWRKGLGARSAVLTLFGCAAGVAAVLLPLAWIYRTSGLPMPQWRGVTLYVSVVVIAYPVAVLLIASGLRRYWDAAGMDEAFLIGWALGCLALTLAGPFFPYPDRGTMTLQIPLFIIAGSIYFMRRDRVGPLAVLALVVLIGSTPAWILQGLWQRTAFTEDQPHKWLSRGHVETIRLLSSSAAAGDVLVADQPSLRWLAPEYPGIHYAGHFFLTAHYGRKQERLQRFLTDRGDHRESLLRESRARFLYVSTEHDATSFESLDGLRLLRRDRWGTLFEFQATAEAR